MFIKSIELSGFKSYGTKTEILGFDPLFNAITGLNGSGKSNILDSICFVLGITNLAQVRAGSLQDLVYKNGQAGITKAAVSITFDNTDPRTSPVGYETLKEIVITRIVIIGGKNKYLINGSIANNSRVQDFFQSVQLNVNNPHFLIMQGRITKVLNMKPMEILSMVEEAVGTRMYEHKKEASLKLISKKEDRLLEIDRILTEDITPTLTKLKEERKDYVEYTKIVREYEHLSKLYVAWQFLQAQQMNLKSSEDAKKLEEELENTKERVVTLKSTLASTQQHIAELEKKKDEEVGGKLAELEATFKDQQMEESCLNNRLKNLKTQVKEDNKKKTDLNKQLTEERNLLVKKELELEKMQGTVEKLRSACKNDTEAKEAAIKRLQDVNAGLYTNSEGEAKTLAAQLMAAQEEVAAAKTAESVAKSKLPFLTKDLTQKQAECKGADGSYKKTEANYKALEKEVNNLKQSIAKLNFQEGAVERLLAEKNKLENEVDYLQQALDTMHSRFPQLTFEYPDQVKGGKVYGLVCNLFKVPDPAKTTALEIAAGSRLYNVVVDTDHTGKVLLSSGKLKQRWTIIPLNKIIGHPIPKNVVQIAESLVRKENVSTALSCIQYDNEVAKAMEYVFGGMFVASNMESARQVAFGKGINRKCVTLEGEVFDPAGTLSGGSMSNRNRILSELAKIKSIEEELRQKQQIYNKVCKELQQVKIIAQKFSSLQETLEINLSKLDHLKNQLEGSTYHQQLEEVASLKRAIEEQKMIIENCKDTLKKAEKKAADLQHEVDNEKSSRDRIIKEASKFVDECQKKLSISEKAFTKSQQEFDQLVLEIGEIKKSIEGYEKQLDSLLLLITEHEKSVEEADEVHQQKKASVAEMSEQVKEQKAILKAHSLEIGKLCKETDGIKKEVDNCTLRMQELQHDVAKSINDSKNAQKNVEHHLSSHPWIENEKKFFGVANTEYDFTDFDARSSAARLKKLEETKAKLSKSVNTRAQNMLQSAEEQYKDLMVKKKVVLNDKEQIQNVIRELDEKKKIALRSACERVNYDFGSIFSTLLPGAKAKLVPQEGHDVLEGLEFKVGFGDAWKESLTELSGGQRSLVALSLILSLLLFKPAPIYILDEVDAALDLSHTQNIGLMLKKHFAHSQASVAEMSEQVKEQKAILKAHSLEIGKLCKETDGIKKEVDNCTLRMQELQHDVAKSINDSKNAQKNVEHHLSSHPWIENEKKFFGVANTEYDFTDFDARSSAARLKKLEETKAKLSKSVNTRAQNMLQSAEEQYKDLMVKKKVVLNDKEQIQNVIRELDEKKKIALRSACERVNYDFGSIFSTLLPGAKAKLVPQEGHDVLEGLEFKVGFGDAWKESLTELSGGQRSLVALSLILSLLLFKPAPIYILDEVDAALDLSHTQNIGLMLKKHFAHSQFIVVSLKDGMFNNANVLFKTRFVDGMSTVTRTTIDQSKFK